MIAKTEELALDMKFIGQLAAVNLTVETGRRKISNTIMTADCCCSSEPEQRDNVILREDQKIFLKTGS